MAFCQALKGSTTPLCWEASRQTNGRRDYLRLRSDAAAQAHEAVRRTPLAESGVGPATMRNRGQLARPVQFGAAFDLGVICRLSLREPGNPETSPILVSFYEGSARLKVRLNTSTFDHLYLCQ